MSGFWAMPSTMAVVSTAISTEPATAVPTEMPRLLKVFCRPPTSPVSSAGTADTVTLPSCEARQPMPRPTSSIGHSTTTGVGVEIDAGEQHDAGPTSISSTPTRTTSRGEMFGHSFGMPSAATITVIDSGTSRIPVSSAFSSSTTDRNSGTMKK